MCCSRQAAKEQRKSTVPSTAYQPICRVSTRMSLRELEDPNTATRPVRDGQRTLIVMLFQSTETVTRWMSEQG